MQTLGSWVEGEKTLGAAILVHFCITAHTLLWKLQCFYLITFFFSFEAFAVAFPPTPFLKPQEESLV